MNWPSGLPATDHRLLPYQGIPFKVTHYEQSPMRAACCSRELNRILTGIG